MFFVLPVDFTFLQEWLPNLKDISSLDIAVTNTSLRPFLMEWLSVFVANCKITDITYNNNFVQWLIKRNIKVSELTIHSFSSTLINLVPLAIELDYTVRYNEDYSVVNHLKSGYLKHLTVRNLSLTDSRSFFSQISARLESFTYCDHRIDSSVISFIQKNKDTLKYLNFSFCDSTDPIVVDIFKAIGSCNKLDSLILNQLDSSFYDNIFQEFIKIRNILHFELEFSRMVKCNEKTVASLFFFFSNVRHLKIPHQMFYLGSIIRSLPKIKEIELYKTINDDETMFVTFENKRLIDGQLFTNIVFTGEKPHFFYEGRYDIPPIFQNIGITLPLDEDDDENIFADNEIKPIFDGIFSDTKVRFLEYHYSTIHDFNFLTDVDHISLYYQNHESFIKPLASKPVLFARFCECEFSRYEYNYSYDHDVHDVNRRIFSSAKRIIISDCYISIPILDELFRIANNLESFEIYNSGLLGINNGLVYSMDIYDVENLISSLQRDGYLSKLRNVNIRKGL